MTVLFNLVPSNSKDGGGGAKGQLFEVFVTLRRGIEVYRAVCGMIR